MRKRIFASICAIALGGLLLMAACAALLMYQDATNDSWERLTADASYMAAGYQQNGQGYLEAIKGYPGRITLVAADGTVLFDDREHPASMENHANRPEVAAALETGTGKAQRDSETLGERTLYYAQRMADGSVLRLSMQSKTIVAQVVAFLPLLAAAALVLVVASAALARHQTRRIVEPINQIDLNDPFSGPSYEELAPLLRRVVDQRRQIDHQVGELRRAKEEFSAITSSMEEGLVVTDGDAMVLTVNESALRILDAKAAPDGPVPVLALDRSLVLEQAARQAAAGTRTEAVMEAGGRQYRLVGSPIRSHDGQKGAVLLMMDDTDKLLAEQSRREFSANVSHELKTPLTSISGYAELIENGVAKPKDVPGFAAKIHDEAARLIALVEDIIRLSRLDERQTAVEREDVDLLCLARQTAESLEPAARERDVALSVEGEEATINGAPTILLEVLYNLAENAIRYNRPGGTVTLRVAKDGDGAKIEVADTGIGIPPQHLARVFERFYRVDKSHSRQSGGTGLGLSIAKRGAIFHGGRVEVASEEGKGSTFTVWLPKG